MKKNHSHKQVSSEVSPKVLAERKRKIDLVINERKYKIRDFLCSDFAMNNMKALRK